MFLKEYDSENSSYIPYYAVTCIRIQHAGVDEWCVKVDTHDGNYMVSPYFTLKEEAEHALIEILKKMEDGGCSVDEKEQPPQPELKGDKLSPQSAYQLDKMIQMLNMIKDINENGRKP